MKLLRCYVVYLRASFRFLVRYGLVCVAFFSLLCLAFRLEVYASALGDLEIAKHNAWGVGDYLFYALCGCVELGKMERVFSFPIGWFSLFALLCYGCLRFPFGEKNAYGYQYLISAGSRPVWWLARSLWSVFVCSLFWALLFVVAAVFTWEGGGAITFAVSPELFYLIEFPWRELKGFPYSITTVALCAVSLSLGIVALQSIVSFAGSPIAGYGVALAVWILGAMGPLAFPFCSGAMAARSCSFVIGGADSSMSAVVGLVVAIVLTGVGCALFSWKSLLGKDDR